MFRGNGTWWNDTVTTEQSSVRTSSDLSSYLNESSSSTVEATPTPPATYTLPSEVLYWQGARAWTYKIGSPIIILCGTACNILTLLVLRRMRSESSSFVLFFTALAMSDLSLIYVGLLPIWIRDQFNYSFHDTYQVPCKLFFWLFYSFGGISAWLLTAMTIQRAVSVVWPHKVRSSCTKRQAYITIAAIVLTFLLIESHLMIFVEVHPVVKKCFFNDIYIQHFLDVWLWVDLLGQSLVPFLGLILSNSVLVWSVVRAVREARRHLAGATGEDQVAAREKRLSSMTLTLMVVSTAFVVLTSPIALLSLYTFYLGEVDAQHDVKYAFSTFMAAISNLLWYTNSSINFLLYILTGSRFRQEFQAMLGMATGGKSGKTGPKGGAGANHAKAAAKTGPGGHPNGVSQGPASSEEF